MEKQMRILHLGNVESDSEIIEKILNESELNFQFLRVNNKKDFQNALEEYPPDVILCDNPLHSFTPMHALRIVKNNRRRIPFILIASQASVETAVDMMKEGIDVYLIKERLHRLPGSIISVIGDVSVEVEKEKHYRESVSQERRFRALIENSHEAIVLSDTDFKTIYRSPSATRLTGWTMEDLKGRTFLDHAHPDDETILNDLVKNVFRKPAELFNGVFRLQTKTRGYIWIDATFTNLLEDANVKAIVINFRDITTKKNLEDELKKSGKHFKALIENISEAIVLISKNGIIQYHSSSSKRLIGFEPEELTGRSLFDFFHPQEILENDEILKKVLLKPEVPIHLSLRILHKRGHFVWVEGTVTNLLDDDSVKAVVVNYRDITERKRSEEVLQKSEANLKTIFDSTDISYVFTDKNLKLLSYNLPAYIGYRRELGVELREGDNVVDYLPKKRRAMAMEQFELVLKGEKVNYEVDFVQADKSTSWYCVDILAVHGEQGQTLGLIVSSEDITARKITEMERDTITRDLVQRNKDLEQFSYIVSHNLRAPVANILGLTEIILSENFINYEDLKKCTKGLELSVSKLDEVIRDLNYILQVRKEINGRKETIKISELIRDIETSVNILIEKENITIKTDFSEIDEIFTIKSYLHSILYNLITNSIKYRKSDYETLIGISSRTKNNKIILKIRDNGLGMDIHAYEGKIFGLYKKFHFHVEGKGMGLYMVKTQVEILGGTIDVESEVNKGTTFTIELPLVGNQLILPAQN